MKDEQHHPSDVPEQPFDAPFDARFEALMRDAARTYNRAPDGGPPDVEALWSAIDRELSTTEPAPQPAAERPTLTVVRGTVDRDGAPQRGPYWRTPPSWIRTAAVLLLGVALGRATATLGPTPGVPSAGVAIATSQTGAAADSADAAPSDAATNEYLGRAEALLAALPEELRARRADPTYLSRADALLLETRLLLDSPASADPALRSLFDDLEIVLAQVVRLQAGRDETRVDLLTQALEQRDVMPRLRDAVAGGMVADNAAN